MDELKEEPSANHSLNNDEDHKNDASNQMRLRRRRRRILIKKSTKKFRGHTGSPCLLERKYCFNEKKLKEVLAMHDVPLSFKHLRILKEHAASSSGDIVDFMPAFKVIEKGLPKSERKRFAASIERSPNILNKTRNPEDALLDPKLGRINSKDKFNKSHDLNNSEYFGNTISINKQLDATIEGPSIINEFNSDKYLSIPINPIGGEQTRVDYYGSQEIKMNRNLKYMTPERNFSVESHPKNKKSKLYVFKDTFLKQNSKYNGKARSIERMGTLAAKKNLYLINSVRKPHRYIQ